MALPLVLGACGPVKVEVPDLDLDQQEACESFLADVPAPLVDLEEVEVSPADAPARAFGDPPLVVSCVDSVPADFDEFAFCVEVNGVGWYLPDAQLDDDAVAATFTAVGYDPIVSVQAPPDYRPEKAAAALSELSDPVEEHLSETRPCR